MMNFYLLSTAIFFALLAVLIFLDKKIEIKGILIMRRTKKFSKFIDNIANPNTKSFKIFAFLFSISALLFGVLLMLQSLDVMPVVTTSIGAGSLCLLIFKPKLFWKVISGVAVIMCLFFMAYGTYSLLLSANAIFSGAMTQSGVQIVLPNPFGTMSSSGGVLLIPFWFWIIIIAAIVVPHELFHGIVARSSKIKLKSVGLLMFLFFPGAFVEPDEKQLKKSKFSSKLRVFAAGSFANIIFAAIVLAILSCVVWPSAFENGILITNVTADSPAAHAGLQPNTTILYANGKLIKASYPEFVSGRGFLYDEIKNVTPGDKIVLSSKEKDYVIDVGEKNGKAYVGIFYTPMPKKGADYLLILYPLLSMMWLFSLGVGVFNILPIYPLDGGLMLEAFAERYAKKHKEKIVRIVGSFILFLIIYNFFGPMLRF
jgi:membrane-associated protease RseP (regulator of RpoE activity)